MGEISKRGRRIHTGFTRKGETKKRFISAKQTARMKSEARKLK